MTSKTGKKIIAIYLSNKISKIKATRLGLYLEFDCNFLFFRALFLTTWSGHIRAISGSEVNSQLA